YTDGGDSAQKTIMDTDDLSNEAYQGRTIEAEKIDHDLTLHFVVLVASRNDDEDYLDKASDFITKLRSLDEEELIDVFFGNLPETKLLNLTLNRIIENIDQVRKMPKDQRHYEF